MTVKVNLGANVGAQQYEISDNKGKAVQQDNAFVAGFGGQISLHGTKKPAINEEAETENEAETATQTDSSQGQATDGGESTTSKTAADLKRFGVYVSGGAGLEASKIEAQSNNLVQLTPDQFYTPSESGNSNAPATLNRNSLFGKASAGIEILLGKSKNASLQAGVYGQASKALGNAVTFAAGKSGAEEFLGTRHAGVELGFNGEVTENLSFNIRATQSLVGESLSQEDGIPTSSLFSVRGLGVGLSVDIAGVFRNRRTDIESEEIPVAKVTPQNVDNRVTLPQDASLDQQVAALNKALAETATPELPWVTVNKGKKPEDRQLKKGDEFVNQEGVLALKTTDQPLNRKGEPKGDPITKTIPLVAAFVTVVPEDGEIPTAPTSLGKASIPDLIADAYAQKLDPVSVSAPYNIETGKSSATITYPDGFTPQDRMKIIHNGAELGVEFTRNNNEITSNAAPEETPTTVYVLGEVSKDGTKTQARLPVEYTVLAASAALGITASTDDETVDLTTTKGVAAFVAAIAPDKKAPARPITLANGDDKPVEIGASYVDVEVPDGVTDRDGELVVENVIEVNYVVGVDTLPQKDAETLKKALDALNEVVIDSTQQTLADLYKEQGLKITISLVNSKERYETGDIRAREEKLLKDRMEKLKDVIDAHPHRDLIEIKDIEVDFSKMPTNDFYAQYASAEKPTVTVTRQLTKEQEAAYLKAQETGTAPSGATTPEVEAAAAGTTGTIKIGNNDYTLLDRSYVTYADPNNVIELDDIKKTSQLVKIEGAQSISYSGTINIWQAKKTADNKIQVTHKINPKHLTGGNTVEGYVYGTNADGKNIALPFKVAYGTASVE